MLSANFKPKSTAAASRGFLATARLSFYLAALAASMAALPTNSLRRVIRSTESFESVSKLKLFSGQRMVSNVQ